MYDPLTILLAANITLLTVVVIVLLIVIILTLRMLNRTMEKVQSAVDTVEDKALETLEPLRGVGHMFSDAEGIVNTARAWFRVLSRKRRRSNS